MSERKTYNKLVRDRILEIIAADGRQCATEIMKDDEEFRHALLVKLVEEAQEVADAEHGDMVKEIADLYEVIDALLIAFDLNKETIFATQKKRCNECGGFEKRIKLLWTD
jgi:predicted house-cleaning noncanonical NTP pyrophosphatase (MazG superfamily)